jgi:hypothetical protein
LRNIAENCGIGAEGRAGDELESEKGTRLPLLQANVSPTQRCLAF